MFLFPPQAYSSPKDDPELSEEEKKIILGGSKPREPVTVIPWKLILSKPPVWALIISHFCHNWGTFILLTWMPTYYNQACTPTSLWFNPHITNKLKKSIVCILITMFQVLKFNLTESGLLCVLPWFTMAVLANVGGWIADTLVSRGLSITSVRKARHTHSCIFTCLFTTLVLSSLNLIKLSSLVCQIMQSIGFLGPAFFLTQLSRVKTPAMAVLCMACSQVCHHHNNSYSKEQ